MTLGAFSIRWKLVLLTMLTSIIALAVACGIFATYDVVTFRRELVYELTLEGDMVGANSTAALAFDDDRAAAETLAALTNDLDIRRALLYAADGRVFAEYRRPDAEHAVPPPQLVAAHSFSPDRLVVWRPIVSRGEYMGTIYIENDLSELRERLYRYSGIVAFVMLMSGLIAFLLSSRLQRIVSEPIGELVETANMISLRHDYSLRVANRRRDEIGVLIDGFNGMLGQVELRDLALVKAQDELEDRVDERTMELRLEIAERQQTQAELERAKDVAESATRAKSTFLANMSHEIRTPINVIIGMTDMALDGELARETRDYLQTVRRATLGLLAIINDILDSAKIESGKVTLEAVDVSLRAVVVETVELLAMKAREQGLSLAYLIGEDVPEHVYADPGRIKQLLTNLIGNAIKFTKIGSVTVGFAVLSRSATHVRLRGTVRDTGIGIPPDRQAAIFESFTQADDSTTRVYGGTGLGLTICRQLVDLMDGTIGVDSEPGTGSTFWFDIALPLVHSDQGVDEKPAAYA